MLIQAPVGLLLDPKLSPADKVVWLAGQLHRKPTLAKLQASSGLSVATIRKSLARLPAVAWHGPNVKMPVDLLRDPELRPGAKVLFGLLQTLEPPAFTYKQLSTRTGTSVVTVRETVRELTHAAWLQSTQTNQLAPICFTLSLPEDEVAMAQHRLEQFHFTPESIMKEYLTLLIDCDEFEDNARPGFLVNPLTGERMELDRYYPGARVAFEYNGWQHYRTTKQFPSETKLANQMARDLIKTGLCAQRGITIVVVHREDLTLKGMQAKVGNLLPLRDLRHHTALIEYLAKQ